MTNREIDQRALLIAKDAEIERLKADVEYWHHIATVEKNGLITELCDALDEWPECSPWDKVPELIQRGREATL